MEIRHQDIIKSIEEKPIKERHKWQHLFLIKHKFGGCVNRYLKSMGDFIEEPKVWKSKVTECHLTSFHGIECLESGEDYGFEGCFLGRLDHPDPRPGHAIWLNKTHAEKLFKLFAEALEGDENE